MNTIINSLIATEDKDLLKELLSSEFISTQEQSYLNFISESLTNSGNFPPIELVHSTFPEIKPQTPLTLESLQVYVANFLTKRRNLHLSQELMKLATKVSQQGLSNVDLDPFMTSTSSDTKSISTPQDYISLYNSQIDQPRGITTNIKVLDDLIGNISYGDTAIIFGYTSHGKSLLVNNIIYHNAMINKYNGCIISLEVPKEQVLNNLLIRHSISPDFQDSYVPLNYKKLKNRELNEQEQNFLFNTVLPDFFDLTKHGMIKILDLTDFEDISQFSIKKKLYEVDDEMYQKTGYHLDVVDLDHVNLLKFVLHSSAKKSEFEVCNEFVKFFHDLAIDFRVDKEGNHQKIISLLPAQAGRTGYKKAAKNKGRYDLTAIAEINELERSGTHIIPIFMSDENKLAKEAVVQLLKNREGVTEEEPQIIYCDPSLYAIGDVQGNFNESLSLSELDDVFGSGSIADMF